MKRLNRNLLILTVASAATLLPLLFKQPNQAAAVSGPTGITVSPAFQQVSIKTSESSHPLQFTITNHKSTVQAITLKAQDFNTLGESGGLFFVGTNPTDLQKRYGLAKWLSLPQTSFTIQPGQTVTVHADVLNLPDLQPGGHYGALMISLGAGQSGPGQNIVALHPIASSLLFVTKLDGATYSLALANVSFSHSLFSLPSSLTLRFQNTGNSHLIPRGVATITNSSGRLISKGIVNQNSDIILPQTFRQYHVALKNISNSVAPGHYKLRVDYRFDGFSQFRSYQTSFWLFPVYILGVSILIVLILGYGLRAFKKRVRNKSQK